MEHKPPPQPWKKGAQDDYTAVALEVHLCGDTTGRVWSYHDFQTPGDAEAALTLPHGGTQQVAYALLVEAYRRECFVTALAEMSHNPTFLDDYRKGTPEQREALESRISTAAREVMRRTLEKMGTGAPREILTMLLNSE